MQVDAFDFELPPELIATRPAAPRESARLLRVHQADISDHRIGDLPNLVSPDDLLVFNDTRVIAAALRGTRKRGDAAATISVNLHQQTDVDVWKAFVRPAKRLRVDDVVAFCSEGSSRATFSARVTAIEGGEATFQFDRKGPALDQAIEECGQMPLPPYITKTRAADAQDFDDYQPIFARHSGSVASPTASLHFTERILRQLEQVGVETAFVTLHVGAGTFLPVKTSDTDDHEMHSEFGQILPDAAQAIQACRARGGRVIAVGTTVLRLLETVAADGEGIKPWSGETDIFIKPGFTFRLADMLLTNFHLPKSTLFMLVSAFSGQDVMKRAYAHAIAEGYRFYSYGDACLLERNGEPASSDPSAVF